VRGHLTRSRVVAVATAASEDPNKTMGFHLTEAASSGLKLDEKQDFRTSLS